MRIEEAKGLVIKAGIKLVDTGLIARTWGNVSCRISESSFVITPSGRDYLTLTPEEIVTVKIEDCSYEGTIKPSSEKGIHAEVYKLYPNMNFVIHTHQENASVISASEVTSIKYPGTENYPAGEVLCAAYALPGTKKLRNNVSKALSNTSARAVIMKHHGALCFGENFEETFATAAQLENICHDFVINRYLGLRGKTNTVDKGGKLEVAGITANISARAFTKTMENGDHRHTFSIGNTNPMYDYTFEMSNFAMSLITGTGIVVSPLPPVDLLGSMRTTTTVTTKTPTTTSVSASTSSSSSESSSAASGFALFDQSKEMNEPICTFDSHNCPEDLVRYGSLYDKIYDSIYKHCKDINYILPINTPEIAAVANNGITLKPLLDDFAQIAGIVAKNVDLDPNTIASALKKSSVVLIPNLGALCCGKTKEDAIATQLVTQKACKALVGAAILGKVKPINPLECMLMRFIYLKKYSKQIDQNHK